MTATQTRTAAPNTTPVSSLLRHEERITRLEADNRELRQTIAAQATCLGALSVTMQGLLACTRNTAMVGIGLSDRLTDVLAGIEARLARIELGDERLVP